MAFQTINDAPKLVAWIRRKLGHPIVAVELDDSQILDNITDALQYYKRYSGTTTYENALLVQLSKDQPLYILDDTVLSVLNFDTTATVGSGINTLFSVENTLFNEGMLGDFSKDMGLVSWQLAQQYVDMARDLLIPMHIIDFNPYDKKLKITPTPTEDVVGILKVWSTWDFTFTSPIYNEIWLKQYALALSKISLGEIRGKFSGTALPGGGTINGDSMRAEGLEEKEKLEENIIEFDGEPLGWYVV